jgi:hypothetical protein
VKGVLGGLVKNVWKVFENDHSTGMGVDRAGHAEAQERNLWNFCASESLSGSMNRLGIEIVHRF